MASEQVDRAIAQLNADAAGAEVFRTLEEGDLVVLHGRDGVRGEVFFAVFRFDRHAIVQRWRFAAPIAPRNPSGHSQTDGPSEPDPAVDTGRAKAIVRNYYETVHIRGDHAAIDRFMTDDVQFRHEPGVHDGVAAFKADLEQLTKERTIDEIVLLVGEGDLVFIAARGTHQTRPCVYIDLYRVEDGKLVEHWGFPQEGDELLARPAP